MKSTFALADVDNLNEIFKELQGGGASVVLDLSQTGITSFAPWTPAGDMNGSTSLTNIIFPASVESIATGCFEHTSVTPEFKDGSSRWQIIDKDGGVVATVSAADVNAGSCLDHFRNGYTWKRISP